MKDALGSPQSVLVLGGGSDIAMAIVRLLVKRRTRTVVLAGRHADTLEVGAQELRGLGADRLDILHFDADETASHAAFFDDVFSRHDDIDLVVFGFGVLGDQARAEADPAAALAVLHTNFLGAASSGLHASQRLREQGHGMIVVLSSVAGERARKSNFVYGSSKAGLDAFFQGLGDSLVGTGVKVLIVRPGFVQSKMTAGMSTVPLSTTPEEVAAVVGRALETGAEEVWVPRSLRLVMFALRHLPRPLFRRLKV